MTTFQQPNARLRPFRPTPFGRYTLLAPLSTGGMGELYLARLEGAHGFEKLCVVKKILSGLSSDKEVLERFVNEAKTLARLSHGSIAQVLDLGVHEGEPFLVLEHVDGKDLRRVAARGRERNLPLPLTFILAAAVRVLDALAYVHRKRGEDDRELGLVHRDVSPQNILISYEGEVKLIDFGLAKSVLNPTQTHPSIILGKFLYMSPEQARHAPVDRRSDLYSVGICLYELIAGKNPFEEFPPGELMARVSQPSLPSLHAIDPLFPPDIVALVARAVAPEPSARFHTAEEFRAAVASALLQIDPTAGAESLARFMRETFAADFQSERKLLASLREVRPRERLEPLAAAHVDTGVATPKGPQSLLEASRKATLIKPAPLSFAPTPRSKDSQPLEPEATVPAVYLDESRREALPATRNVSWEAPPGRLEPAVPRRPVTVSPQLEPATEAAVPWTDPLDTPADGAMAGASPSVVVGDGSAGAGPPLQDTQPRVVVGTLLDEPTLVPRAAAMAAAPRTAVEAPPAPPTQQDQSAVGGELPTGEIPASGRAWRIGALAAIGLLVVGGAAALAYKAISDADGAQRGGPSAPMEPVIRQPPAPKPLTEGPPPLQPVELDDEAAGAPAAEAEPGGARVVVMPTIVADEEDELAPLTAAKKPPRKGGKPRKPTRWPTISADWERCEAMIGLLKANGQTCESLGTVCARMDRLRPEINESAENLDIQDRVLKNVRGLMSELHHLSKAYQ